MLRESAPTWEADLPTRFHFDLVNGHDAIRDEEGVEADDLDQAIEQAVAGVDEMRASGEFQDIDAGWELVMRDAGRAEIKRIPV